MFEAESNKGLDSYSQGFSVSDLFRSQCTGVITARDNLAVEFDGPLLREKIKTFLDPAKSDAAARLEFFGSKTAGKYPAGDSRGWKLPDKRKALQALNWSSSIATIQYRPFDYRSILYHQDMVDWPRLDVMGDFSVAPNIALLSPRMTADNFSPLVSGVIVSNKTASRYDQSYFFPLYRSPNKQSEQADAFAPDVRTSNLDPKLYAAICAAAGIDPADTAMSRNADGPHPNPSPEGEGLYDFRAATGDARPSEVKVFDYIYGVLHSPAYRSTYAEFLKIDFPRIPYPKSPEVFAHVSEKGEALRRLHLMETAAIGAAPYRYHGEGDDVVASGFPKFEPCSQGSAGSPSPSGADAPPSSPPKGRGQTGRVFINKDQYFEDVSEIAWNFHIGGYQPAQKWLKDRRGRALSFDDIGHYQKIVKILSETDRIMREIELPLE
ncbi:hypothetical protein KNJ79_04315 [Sphingopyxis indica]|uniref:type ISP restriction/modification enzyme n=1 Tax=Sphingopyxis indica TaxID=436663 RepID=UPI002938D428|nr:type ISP restriction/modification enzyme [Sphingopyxis indica]WOF44165.1 hypothetical protein KNJ79_04315 [Sphingopyxis indica]